jgi:pimeloyl-ACP methyl ester carboxylesterase
MRFGVLFVLLLVLALTASAEAKDLVLRPPLLTTDRVVIFIHGAGGHAHDIEEGKLAAVTEILLQRGFAIAASEAHGPQTWGNPASVADYQHLIDKLGYERVFLLGGSMGGLATMRLIGSVHPEAVAAISPVCNIRAVSDLLQPVISLAWGDSRPAYLSPVVPDPYPGLRVMIWASPEDTWVPAAENAEVCARELRHRGAHVRRVVTEGDHSDPNAVRPRSIADFFSSHS